MPFLRDNSFFCLCRFAARLYEQARQEALCAWMAMASYGDRPGLAARQELVRRGWHIDSQVQKDDKSRAKFHLVRKGTIRSWP